jgi:hypothetical protein
MRVAVLLVLSLATGCGDNISHEDFPAEIRDANCSYYVRCGAFSTFTDCRAYFDYNTVVSPNLDAAINAGKIRYSPSAAEDCIAAYDALDCDITQQPADSLAVCEGVYTGTGDIGDTCAFDRECVSDRCFVANCLPNTCCQGTCQPARVDPGLGELCDGVCAEGLFCDFRDNTCHAELLEGAECSPFEGTVCARPLYCSATRGNRCAMPAAHGSLCEGYCALEGDVCSPDQRICVEALVGGDSCESTSECSSFYVCSNETRRCALPNATVRLPLGRPCTSHDECQSRYCTGTCVDEPLCF